MTIEREFCEDGLVSASPLKGRAFSKWQPIASAPRDGRSILLRFGKDGVSQGQYVPGLPHPWKFIDEDPFRKTWAINYARDEVGGPSHWMELPA